MFWLQITAAYITIAHEYHIVGHVSYTRITIHVAWYETALLLQPMQALTSTRLHFPISFASLATSHFHEKSSPFSPIRISPSSPSTAGIHPWRVNVCSTFPFRLPRWKQTAPGLGHLLSLSYFLCLLISLFPASFLSFSFSFLFFCVYPLIRLSTQLDIFNSFYPSVVSLDSSYDTHWTNCRKTPFQWQ